MDDFVEVKTEHYTIYCEQCGNEIELGFTYIGKRPTLTPEETLCCSRCGQIIKTNIFNGQFTVKQRWSIPRPHYVSD